MQNKGSRIILRVLQSRRNPEYRTIVRFPQKIRGQSTLFLAVSLNVAHRVGKCGERRSIRRAALKKVL
jgi:hypothetical protein